MTAKAKMTDLVLQVRVENGTKADGKAAVKNINFNQLKLDATDQQLLDAGHAAALGRSAKLAEACCFYAII